MSHQYQYHDDYLTPEEEDKLVRTTIAKLKERQIAIIVINTHYHYIYYRNSLYSCRSGNEMGELLSAFDSMRNHASSYYRRSGYILEGRIKYDPEIPHVYYTCTRELSANSRERYDDFYRTWFYQHHMTQFEKQRNNTNANN